MSTINESVSKVRELLLAPKEQEPNVKLIFGSLLREYNNFHNELSNSSVAWTVKEKEITLLGETDILIGSDTGKVLFVTANNDNPYLVDFTDLQDASAGWWYEYPFAAARPEDYNYAAYPASIAFYRKNGLLYARVLTGFSGETLTVTMATGNWTDNVNTEDAAVLSEYHHLVEIRAAMNLADGTRWTDNMEADERKAERRLVNLSVQEQRVYEQFKVAKRSLTVSDVVFIETADGCF